MKLLITLLFGFFGAIATVAEQTPEDPNVSFNLVSHSYGGLADDLLTIL